MGDFHQYYSGEKQVPVLTLVVGGNHEASNYLFELHHGGWLAPNVYYLGDASVLRYGPLRIAGLSGIYKSGDYRKPHHERLPYNRNEMRSVYHVRQCDVSKLLQIRSPLDICISHDWPRRVEWFGDYQKLFTDRPHFFDSVKEDKFGNAPAEQVMNLLRPKYWFSGHMHTEYSAVVEYKSNKVQDYYQNLAVPNEMRNQLPRSMFQDPFKEKKSAFKTIPQAITNTVTQFLALDKPGPDGDFLELLEVNSSGAVGDASLEPCMQKTPEEKFTLHYDEEWLSIIRSLDGSLTNETSLNRALENSGDARADTTSQDLRWIQTNITAKGLLRIPENFEKHAPVYDPNNQVEANEQPCEYPNSQMEAFCEMLQIRNIFSTEEEMTEDDGAIAFG